MVETISRARTKPVVGTFHRRPPYDIARTEWVQCDLRRPGASIPILQNAQCAVICAGQLATTGVLESDPVTPVVDTLRIVTNVLEAAAAVRLQRLVLVSSCTVYPPLQRRAVEADAMDDDPPGQWFGVGWMHRYAEQQLRWYVERLGRIGAGTVLRPTLVYGRYDDFSPQTGHFVPTLIGKVVNRMRPIDIWGTGEQSRNLLHGSDLAGAIMAALEAPLLPYTTFNVVSPHDSTVNEVVRELIQIDGFEDADIRHDLARGGGPASLGVCGRAFREATGWEATMTLRAGLEDTVDWYRRSGQP